MTDILYWITYPIRRFVSWAQHRLGSCHAWCAHCITESETEYWNNLSPKESEGYKWAEFAECQPSAEKTLDKQSNV